MLREITLNYFLVALSSVLLALSFPNFNLWPSAWVGLVPLFFALKDKDPRKAFGLAFLAGAIFFLGTLYWLVHVTLPGMLAVVLYLSVYTGLFGAVVAPSLGKPSFRSLFFVPCVWVIMEYARSHVFGGFCWNLIAHSQAFNLPAIQIADIAGAYGVSFLIVLVNTAVFFTIKDIRNKRYDTFYMAAAVILMFIAAGYGVLRLNNIFTGEKIKVSVVQGNIPQDEKWDAKFKHDILDKYDRLTLAASSDKPDLIIWPETSVPGFMELDRGLFERVSNIAIRSGARLLVGEPRQDDKDEELYYNTAVLFDRDGKRSAHYDKVHLVPFGEFIPAKGLFRFVEKFTKSTIGDFSSGKDYTVFSFPAERSQITDEYSKRLIKKICFSVMICFEDIFPDIARRFVKNGAQFLVNITNDAWFNDSSAPFQHLESSVFRAVENRVNVIRAANTGISCFIDQKGRVFGPVNSGDRYTFIGGHSTDEITLTPARTFYTSCGDLLVYICALFVLWYVLSERMKRDVSC